MKWLLALVAAVGGYLLGYAVAARYEVNEATKPEEGVQPMDPRLTGWQDESQWVARWQHRYGTGDNIQ